MTTRHFSLGPIKSMSRRTFQRSMERGTQSFTRPDKNTETLDFVSLRNGVELSEMASGAGILATGLPGVEEPVTINAELELNLHEGEFSIANPGRPSQTVRSDGSQTLRGYHVLDCHSNGTISAHREEVEDSLDGGLGVHSYVFKIRDLAVKESPDGVFGFRNTLEPDGSWPSGDYKSLAPYLTRQELGLSQSQSMSGPTERPQPEYVTEDGEKLVKQGSEWISVD